MAYKDAGANYFQTSDSIATSERKAAKAKNQHGNPIRLQSKILAVLQDPDDARAIYVAEAAGNIKRVVLETGEKIQVLHATAPLTSIAFIDNKLFAGCWDKNIYVSDYATGKETLLSGHTDFVKCLLAITIDQTPVLISGGADSSIIVWDLIKMIPRYRLKGPFKAVQDLVYDSPEGILYSASSDPQIRKWKIGLDSGSEILTANPIRAHETGVWKMRLDTDSDLWTASADKTAQHLVRGQKWKSDTTLQHPDYVKDIVLHEELGVVVTACRDEDVRVWDITGSLLCTYTGHYEEVTALAVVGRTVVSASIDGTIRRWSLLRTEMDAFTDRARKEAAGEVDQPKSTVSTTAEEDAELDALMDESD